MSWFESWFNSPYYKILYSHRNDQEAADFISRLLTEIHPKPGDTFLDLACGNGRHAKQIAARGYKVTGIDLAEEQIRQAQENNTTGSTFHCHDMRQPWPHQYNFVLNLFTSFGYFSDPAQEDLAMQTAARCLLPNATLVVDFFNAEKVKNTLIPSEEKTIQNIHFKIKRFISNNRVIKQITILDNKNTLEYSEEVNLISPNRFDELLSRQNLVRYATFGNYLMEPFALYDSPRLILFAKQK